MVPNAELTNVTEGRLTQLSPDVAKGAATIVASEVANGWCSAVTLNPFVSNTVPPFAVGTVRRVAVVGVTWTYCCVSVGPAGTRSSGDGVEAVTVLFDIITDVTGKGM